MFNRVMIAFVVFSLVAFNVTARDDKKGDKDKFQGEWNVVSIEGTSQKLNEDAIKKSKLIIKDDEWLATTNGRESKATFKLDESKSPKEIDIKGSGTSGQEATSKAIYKFDGDTLTLCRTSFTKGGDRTKRVQGRRWARPHCLQAS